MNVCSKILENKDALYGVAFIAYSLLELWLGKTNKVQAASALEAGLNLIIKPKSPEDTGNGKAL